MDINEWIKLVVAATPLVGLVGIFSYSIINKKLFMARSIQLIGIVLIIPAISLLSLDGKLEGATVGTLIGAIAGYLLSGISNYDKTD